MNQLMGIEDRNDNWHDWLREWGARFLLFARQQVGTHAEAEDVLQEAMVQVWSKRDQFARIEPGLFFTHIRRMAINRARSEQRRQKREQAYALENQPAWFVPDSGGEAAELEQALGQLPLEQREILVLRIWGEQTFEAIGQTLDISPNTAASRYRYGLENMRRMMKGGVA